MQTTFGTPREAEHAFYAAFESRSVEAMMKVWSAHTEVICIHPQGPRLVGRDAVKNGWQEILAHSPPIRFEVRARYVMDSDTLVAHIVEEHIRIADQGVWQGPILATNLYRRHVDGWKMVLHHASAGPAAAAVTMH